MTSGLVAAVLDAVSAINPDWLKRLAYPVLFGTKIFIKKSPLNIFGHCLGLGFHCKDRDMQSVHDKSIRSMERICSAVLSDCFVF